YEHDRTTWKSAALGQLAGLSITNERISAQIKALKASTIHEGYRDWVGDDVLLMTNGDFLIYAFRHGFNNGFVDHLFLAHTSDGRWLYSTYHFCNRMGALVAEDPPGSIA